MGTAEEELLNAAPRVNDAVDARTLALDAAEAFLLSRIDGATSAADLADLTGRSTGDVTATLQRLADMGAIVWGAYRANRASAGGGAAAAEPTPPASSAPDDDLTPEERAGLDEAARRAKSGSHWEVLGLSGTPSGADVKRAYFAASKRFHPDRFYGKRLGVYAPKLEAIFRRVKAAYDVLSDDEARAAYARRVPPPASDVPQTGSPGAAMDSAQDAAARAAAEAEAARAAEAARLAAEERAKEERLERRRRQLADERRSKAGQAFKRELPTDPVRAKEMFARGLAQLEGGDPIGAFGNFQLAAAYDPQSATYKQRAEELGRQTAPERAQRLIEAGDAELQLGRRAQAASAFAQASDLQPTNVRYARRAAEALLNCGEHVRAWTYAERAVAQGSTQLDVRLVAGAVLEAKGEKAGAVAQYRAAQALDPNDPRVKKALERLSL